MTSSADSLTAELDLSDADNVVPGIVIQSALFGKTSSSMTTETKQSYRYINASHLCLYHYSVVCLHKVSMRKQKSDVI